jgi:hypothetical protein
MSNTGNIPSVVKKPAPLLLRAMEAGVKEEIEGEIEVFLHGTTRRSADRLLDQGDSLSSTGGNHGGALHTIPDANIALEFAKRSATQVPGETPVIVAIALPKKIADSLRNRRLLYSTAISGPPQGVREFTPQHIFDRNALDTLKQQGFFFEYKP